MKKKEMRLFFIFQGVHGPNIVPSFKMCRSLYTLCSPPMKTGIDFDSIFLNAFIFYVQGSLNPKIGFLGQNACPVEYEKQTRK